MESRLRKLEAGYVSLPNDIVRNPSISGHAKAMFWYMASRPDGWVFHIKEIQNNFSEGRDRINKSISELVEHGYLEKDQIREAGKFSQNIYTLSYTPLTEKPLTAKPSTANTSLKNTEYKNTELSKKKKNKKEKVILPDCVHEDIFSKLVKHREDLPKAKKLSVLTQQCLANKLERLWREGEDVIEVIEQTIRNGWKDVYKVKQENQTSGQAKSTKYDGAVESRERWIRSKHNERHRELEKPTDH